MKVLIVYGTRYGMTKLTSETIYELISGLGHTAIVSGYRLEREIKKQLDDFDLLVVGSSIVSGRWKSGVKRFLKKYCKNRKVAVFVTAGGTLNRAEKDGRTKEDAFEKANQNYIEPVIQKYGIQPIKVGVFGGQYKRGSKIKYNNWSKEDIIVWIDDLLKKIK